jgi:hypothetical protein
MGGEMKLKEGMAVWINGHGYSGIKSRKGFIHKKEKQSPAVGEREYKVQIVGTDFITTFYDSELIPLPNHFINNPGAGIMKAEINKNFDKWIWWSDTAGIHTESIKRYTTKAGARNALKRWAKRFGVNIEIVEG